MSTEPLYQCPLCHRPGFTHRGLQTHCCPTLPRITIRGVISRDAPGGSTTTRRQRLPADVINAVLNPAPTEQQNNG